MNEKKKKTTKKRDKNVKYVNNSNNKLKHEMVKNSVNFE